VTAVLSHRRHQQVQRRTAAERVLGVTRRREVRHERARDLLHLCRRAVHFHGTVDAAEAAEAHQLRRRARVHDEVAQRAERRLLHRRDVRVHRHAPQHARDYARRDERVVRLGAVREVPHGVARRLLQPALADVVVQRDAHATNRAARQQHGVVLPAHARQGTQCKSTCTG
jgi:hypothetical protein